MLNLMTKKTFIEAVDQNKFLVKRLTDTKYEVYMIHFDEIQNRFGVGILPNPDTKDGTWRQTGGGYNKAVESILRVADYVDKNAPDKDTNNVSCYDYFSHKQKYSTI